MAYMYQVIHKNYYIRVQDEQNLTISIPSAVFTLTHLLEAWDK